MSHVANGRQLGALMLCSLAIVNCASTVGPADGSADTRADQLMSDTTNVDSADNAPVDSVLLDVPGRDVPPVESVCRTDLRGPGSGSEMEFIVEENPASYAVYGHFPPSPTVVNVQSFGDCATFQRLPLTNIDGRPLSVEVGGRVLVPPYVWGSNSISGNGSLGPAGSSVHFQGESRVLGDLSVDLRIPETYRVTVDQPFTPESVSVWSISRPVRLIWAPHAGTLFIRLGAAMVNPTLVTTMHCRFDARTGMGEISSAALAAVADGLDLAHQELQGALFSLCETEVAITGGTLRVGVAHGSWPSAIFRSMLTP